jgi:hypothetical protein
VANGQNKVCKVGLNQAIERSFPERLINQLLPYHRTASTPIIQHIVTHEEFI